MVNAEPPTTTASISATSYDFGQNIVGNPETQTVVEVTNTGSNPLTGGTVVSNAGQSLLGRATLGSKCGSLLARGSLRYICLARRIGG